MKKDIIREIEKMKLVEEGTDYKLYYNEDTGQKYEIDFDSKVVVAAYELNDECDIQEVLYRK